MTKEMINVIETARNLSDPEWAAMKKELLKEANSEIEDRIYITLKEMGVSSNLNGYYYLKRAIILVLEDPQILHRNVTKTMYPQIAKEENTTWPSVERCIRHAIEKVFEKGDLKKIQEVLGNTYSFEKGKSTNAEFIAGVAEYIKNS